MHASGKFFILLIICWLLPGMAKAEPPHYPSHGITLFGDLKYKRGFQHFDYTNPDAPKGGRIKLAYTATFDSLNPYILKGVPAPLMNYVFETLMTPALDEAQSYYGLIASTIQVDPENQFADITLNPKARWHDGTPITAADVVFSLDILKEKGHPSYQILYKPITKAIALGTYKVRFEFADPSNRELPVLVAALSVLPKHYYDKVEFNKTTLTPPLGSGPYRVAKVDQGRSITFERVKNYWGNDLNVNRGLYNFDDIHVDVYREETVSLEAFKSGRYDFREEYIARNWATSYEIDAVKDGRIIKRRIPHKIPSGMQAFLFNTRDARFADRRVREAIGLAMDYEWMKNTLFYGAYDRSSSFFQNTPFMAKGLPSEGELALLKPYEKSLPQELFEEPYVIPTTDGTGYPRLNLLKAQQLLNDAGWVMRDGVRVNAETGQPLTLEFMMRQRTFERIIGSINRNLQKLGIKGSFRFVDDSQYQKRIDSRDFDVISIWWNRGIFFPGTEQIGFWHSSQADVAGGTNYSGAEMPVIDHLLSVLTTAKTLEELTPAAQALDRVLLWEHYVIPHWHLGAWRIAYWDKFGIPETLPSYGLGMESWWLKGLEKTKK